MIVITDSNILYSALITPNGVVAKILKDKSSIQFFAPNYLVEEINEHSEELACSLGKTRKQILTDFKHLTKRVNIIDAALVPKECVQDALEIVKDIDVDDVFFVALHLFLKHKIWTSDKVLIKGLKNKNYDICITTSELKKHLYKK